VSSYKRSIEHTTDKHCRYAMPLYLQATSLLIPPPPRTSSPEDRCRGMSQGHLVFLHSLMYLRSGAQLMSNLSELMMRASTSSSPEQAQHLRQQAEAWARKARDIIAHTKPPSDSEAMSLCDVALAATLFNLGTLREVASSFLSFAYSRS
jgi:hypothetical protein